MLRRRPRSDLGVPSDEWLHELRVGVADGSVGHNGQMPSDSGADVPHLPGIATPTGAEELQRLFGAGIGGKAQLAAHVRRLEAELRRSWAELAQLRGQLRGAVHEALTDPLTGLANRRSFERELRAVMRCAGRSSPAHLVMADIDHFKRVNDTHGHDIGDGVLRIVGEILLANVRRDVLVARLGGDEFGVLLPGASSPYAAAIAKRLCHLLASRPLVVRGFPEVSAGVTLSIGVAGWHAGESSARWCARADAALYEAKRRGRNCISVARMLEHEF
jgi:diguanylate cyclase